MEDILAVVLRFLGEDGWPYTSIEGQPIVRTGFQGDNGTWTCFIQVRGEQEQCVIYSICPVRVPEEKRASMAELLVRANYGLIVGNFEMDLEDGEIRYKTGIDVQDDRLSEPLFRNLIYTNVITMDRYLPAIMAFLYGDVTPAEAVARIEG